MLWKFFRLCVGFSNELILMFQLQFCLTFIHSSQLIFNDCGYPRWSVWLTMPNAIFFYFLFADFYNKSYKPSSPKEEPKKINGHANDISNGLNNKYDNDDNKKDKQS